MSHIKAMDNGVMARFPSNLKLRIKLREGQNHKWTKPERTHHSDNL